MFEVKRVTLSDSNRKDFRTVARDSSGETFAPSDGERLVFAYENRAGSKTLVGVACFRPGWRKLTEPLSSSFLDNHFHVVTYLFVKAYYKGQGIGSMMLQFIEKELRGHAKRTVRVQSAEKAARFFERHGYIRTGETVDCVCSGSPLFSRLVNMEKQLTCWKLWWN